MCGMCGILASSDSFLADADVVTTMRDTMAHRGPDDGGTWTDPSARVALGHRRLSIVDLSPAGHQPMCNEDGTVWLTYNGEIYNHASLRAELEAKGHTYRSNTDSETIIHLYEEEGPRCVERLEGMFGFGIWDARKRELFLARDRLGIKPVYYAQPPGGFLFASEIKALLEHPSISPDLDEEAFHHYLTFVCTPAPLTMFKGIRKLGPSERMVVRADGTVRQHDTYWSPLSQRAVDAVADMDEDQLAERLIELLRGSIDKHMMSDVPFGVFLSGGVDSTTNVALMSELMSTPVQTFSVGFEDHERYNELSWARDVAKRFGTDHHEVVIGWDASESFLPELIHHQDEPIADWVCVPLYYVSKLARDNGTIVVQVGEGADEIFHGYQKYVDHVRAHRRFWGPFDRVPRTLRMAAGRGAMSLSRRTNRGVIPAQQLAEAAAGRLPFWGGAIAWQGDLKDQLLADGPVRPDSYEVVDRLWQQAERDLPGADLLQKMTYLELKQRLAELLLMRVDKMTMATSVEARVPYLDHQLVEFALALPPKMKIRDDVGKWLMKRAVDGIIPSDVVWRKKQGFGAPMAEWFRGELGDRAQEQIRTSSLNERGLIDLDRVDEMWAAHRAGPVNWSFHLWNLYNVSAWHDYWVAGRALV